MTPETINNFKTAIETTQLIKEYAQNGYGSVTIVIVAGEVTEVREEKKFRFERDYGDKK